ncbi:unnamed protein product, partial [Rotaria sp. Silwood2]
ISQLFNCIIYSLLHKSIMQVINLILLSILAVLLPPVTAIIKVGCTSHFWLNLLLTLLGWLPGVVHALWLIWDRSTTA